jgi:hypothetical protein
MEKRKSWRAEDLDVFMRAYELSLELHRASLDFPKIEQYAGLADQLRRASKSVCGLIVEGSGRQAASPKEFARYLMMAVGSRRKRGYGFVTRSIWDICRPSRPNAGARKSRM